MNYLKDYNDLNIRLTDERKTHILEHPEMAEMESFISETLCYPEIVVQSKTDSLASLYYRYYLKIKVGNKFLCVIVKKGKEDAFILTAYLTDKVKDGEIIWKKNQ